MSEKVLYTAEATVTGGRDRGHGRTSDGALEVDLRLPGSDGSEQATNPEQLFAIGYAACFEGAIKVMARRLRLDAGQVRIESKVNLHPTAERGFKLSAELHCALPGVGDEQAVEIVRSAHAVCPYSEATRGNMRVLLTANGRPV